MRGSVRGIDGERQGHDLVFRNFSWSNAKKGGSRETKVREVGGSNPLLFGRQALGLLWKVERLLFTYKPQYTSKRRSAYAHQRTTTTITIATGYSGAHVYWIL